MARIVQNPEILGGKPVIDGTRLSVELVLDLHAAGWTTQKVLDEYPALTVEAIEACFAYARDIVAASHQAAE